jgi:hypothetical protein
MKPDPLSGPRLKIERAKRHIKELQTDVRALLDRKPHKIVTDKNVEKGMYEVKVQMTECIPAEFAVIIGDVIHNLRASLDLLACALATQNGATDVTGTNFPFGKDLERFKTEAKRKIKKLSLTASRFIHRLKPYKGGNDTLWQIHAFDIVDKHRLLIPVGTIYLAQEQGISLPFEVLRKATRENPISAKMTVSPIRQFTLDKDIPIAKIPIKDVDAGARYQLNFTIGIAFGEGQIVEGDNVVETLQKYIDLVEHIIGIADRRFFR